MATQGPAPGCVAKQGAPPPAFPALPTRSPRGRLAAPAGLLFVPLLTPEHAARNAVRTSAQFNIIHPGSGLKIDVYVNPNTPYDRARLTRRRRLPLLPDVTAYFASPEDVILYKLLYYRQVESGSHLRDILGILRVSGPELDESYIRGWAERLGLGPLWEQIRKQAE